VSQRVQVTFEVNARSCTVEVEPRHTLADVLRMELGLTGTHVGCEHGVCGACTVIVDGAAVRSCLMFAVQAEGARVRTIEGMAPAGELHPIQRALKEHHGLQCGFCTPGFVMLIAAALEAEPAPTDEQIVHLLSSNLCRCTGYQGIVAAVRSLVGRDVERS
jgi:aerobic carbon-monoxide dehydrogenase small subunit